MPAKSLAAHSNAELDTDEFRGMTMPSAPVLPSSHAKTLARDNNAFALDLYARIKKNKENLFFSPYSVSAALAMTYAGARGRTAEQMARALRFEFTEKSLHAAFGELEQILSAAGQKAGVEIVSASSLWPQERFFIFEEFSPLIEKYYGATVTPLDYSAADAPDAINRWVASKTDGKIRDLISDLGPLTALVLVNAIYFKGEWASRFKKEFTREAPFHVEPGKTVQVEMMTQTDHLGYAALRDLEILEISYRGGDLSMLVLLPREKLGLPELEARLTSEQLEKWMKRVRPRKVRVFLPRFQMRWRSDLSEPLAALGLTDAFTENADFSKISDGRLSLGAVLHAAFVDVNEEGTEAAAATAGAIFLGLEPEEPTFRADHAFLFLIRDLRSGSILFLGRVADPSSGSQA